MGFILVVYVDGCSLKSGGWVSLSVFDATLHVRLDVVEIFHERVALTFLRLGNACVLCSQCCSEWA